MAKMLAAGVLVAAGMVCAGAGAVVFAPVASAGCEPRPMGVTYCDGPVQADGSWRRCFYNSPVFVPGAGNFGGAYVPGGGNCYNVPGPGGDPFPWAPQEWLVGTG